MYIFNSNVSITLFYNIDTLYKYYIEFIYIYKM